jgi:hypothetical protein
LDLAARGQHPIPDRVDIAGAADRSTVAYVVAGEARQPDERSSTAVFTLALPFLSVDKRAGTVTVDYVTYPPGSTSFFDALASVEGLVPEEEPSDCWFASSLDGRTRAAYVPSDQHLDAVRVEELRRAHAEHVDGGGSVRIYYHRGDRSQFGLDTSDIHLRRIPFDLSAAAGAQ